MNNNYYIYYHGDTDGKGSAAVVILYLLYNKYITNWNDEHIKLIQYNYEKLDSFLPLQDYKENDEVYIVDLSVDCESITKFIAYLDLLENKKVVLHWIDHHISSVDAIKDIKKLYQQKYHNIDKLYDIVINTDFCGMYNCWKHFFKNLPMPEIIRLIDDWDCWKHKLSTTKDFHYGFDSSGLCEPTNENWKSYLLNRGDCLKLISMCVNSGKSILNYIKYSDISRYKYHFECKFCGFNCCCLNAVRDSDLFLDNINNYDIVLAFMYNGKNYKYSLYCSKDSKVKCNIIASMFGGGGHKGAAGFHSKKLVVNNYNSIIYKIKDLFRRLRYNRRSAKV